MKPSPPMVTRSSERSISPDVAIQDRLHSPAIGHGAPAPFWATVRGDYRRHGSKLASAAFLSLCIYRFGRWGLHRRTTIGRKLVSKAYGFVNLFVANITKIWIPPQVVMGRDFHIVHDEGSLSIHPDVVIGDRLGVMHNVTIGTNMGHGSPVIGDDVFIGVNSAVLGPIRIGDRVRIAANSAVTTDVPSDSIVVGSPARIFPRLGPFR